jgi:hypothetical protein
VTVSNPSPGGGSSAPQSFIITQPSVVPKITSVSPATIPAYFPTTLTINGTGFVQGAALDVVGTGGGYWNTNFVSSTQLTITNFSVGSPGATTMYVIDPAPAGTSAAFTLTVTQPPAPSISSISPADGSNSAGPTTLTINGANFLIGALVQFNGSGQGTTFISATQLSILIDLKPFAAGNYPVVVVNPYSAGTSNAVNFAVTGTTDFSISTPGPTSATITAGQTATFTNIILVSGIGGFSSPVNLSCSLPATATHCSVNPVAINPGQSATITVTTTARALLPPTIQFPRFNYRPLSVYVVFLALILAAIVYFIRLRRLRLAFSVPLAAIALFLVIHSAGCGGGSSTPPPPPPPAGTPPGSYAITVTATSGNLTHTGTLTLVVN